MVNTGLAGIKVVTTSITKNDPEYGLMHRGYPVTELIEKCSYDEGVFLMLYKRLPDSQELRGLRKALHKNRKLPEELRKVIELMPETAKEIDVVRSAFSVLGGIEPENQENSVEQVGIRLVALYLPILAYWYHFSRTRKQIKTQTLESDSVAENFLKILFQQSVIPKENVKALDTYLFLYIDNDMNAGTFASRVASSTVQDLHASVVAGTAAQKGLIHGGAIYTSYAQAAQYKSVEEAEIGVKDLLMQKVVVYGFGHRIYKGGDPRVKIAKQFGKQLSEKPGANKTFFAVQEKFEEVMEREKGLKPNADWYCLSILMQLGVHPSLFVGIATGARVAGMIAHVMEQRQLKKIIRPSTEYIGPEARPVPALERRDPVQEPRL